MTAGHITWTSRALLGVAVAVLAVVMLGPFSGLEHRFLLNDKQAHILAFFGATTLAFLAFPRMRRNDICLIALALGAAVEIVQALTGRDIQLTDIAADSVGIYLLMVPVWIEQVRSQHRTNPWGPLMADIRAADRRKPMFARRLARGVVAPQGDFSPTGA